MRNQQKETLRQRIRMAAEQMDLPEGMMRGMPQVKIPLRTAEEAGFARFAGSACYLQRIKPVAL